MIPTLSPAEDIILFGPNKYVRVKDKPTVYTDTFRGTPGTGKLIIRNDGRNCQQGVSSAKVFLNEKQYGKAVIYSDLHTVLPTNLARLQEIMRN